MSYWVTYRVGYFPLKERFYAREKAEDRAAHLRRTSFYSEIVREGDEDPYTHQLLNRSIEMASELLGL